MSNDEQPAAGEKRIRSSYTPARMTVSEFEQFAEVIKKLVNDSGLKWWIIAAGIGAIAETLHILWLAASYLAKMWVHPNP
jgi:hypothetical protein